MRKLRNAGVRRYRHEENLLRKRCQLSMSLLRLHQAPPEHTWTDYIGERLWLKQKYVDTALLIGLTKNFVGASGCARKRIRPKGSIRHAKPLAKDLKSGCAEFRSRRVKMLQIIRPAESKTEYAYRRIFRSDKEAHGFLCDDNGNPVFKNKSEEKQYNKCLTKPNTYKDCGRERRSFTHHSPALAECECGRKLYLNRFVINCDCGRRYDSKGKEITGERK